jgi:hypothetical protein
MKLTIESTTKIITIVTPDGDVPARLWQGYTDTGIPVHCYITRVNVPDGLGASVYLQFERELQEQRAPAAEVNAIPLRMIL